MHLMLRRCTILLMCVLMLPGCVVALLGAGVGSAAYVAGNRREASVVVDDNLLDRRIKLIIDDNFGGIFHVNVTSYNGQVLLTGEAPDGRGKEELGERVSKAEGAKKVFNFLTIGESTGFTARSNDAVITGNVKSLLVKTPEVSAIDVKIVTEANVVYLMGLVSEKEADAAINVARTGKGVAKVVPLFEILNDDDPRLKPKEQTTKETTEDKQHPSK